MNHAANDEENGIPAGTKGGPCPTVRVAGLALRGDSVLLVRQQKGDETYWLLPGGGVERGERLEEALERELMEECNLRAHITAPPLAMVQVISPDGGRSRHLIQIVFEAAVLAGESPTAADSAIEEVRWMPVKELRDISLHPPIADVIERCASTSARRSTTPTEGMAVSDVFVDAGVRWQS